MQKLKTKPRQTKKEIIRGHVCRDKNAAWSKKQTEYPVAAMNYYERLPNTTTRTLSLLLAVKKNYQDKYQFTKKRKNMCISALITGWQEKNGPPS